MQVKCNQCGAELKVKPNERFFSCNYCGSSLYLDASQISFHYYLAPKIIEKDLKLILSSFLQRKNLKKRIKIEKKEIFYFPFWLLKGGEKGVKLKLAASTAIDEIEKVVIPPAGKLNFFNPENENIKGKKIVAPGIAYEAIKKNMEDEIKKGDFSKIMLLHLPFFLCQYEYAGEKGVFTVLIDAVGGKVFANSFPHVSLEKINSEFFWAIGITCMIFFMEGLMIKNLLVKTFVYFISAFPLYLLLQNLLRKKR